MFPCEVCRTDYETPIDAARCADNDREAREIHSEAGRPIAKVLIGDRMVEPTRFQMLREMICYLFGSDSSIICPKCALKYDLVENKATAVYPVNIVPYTQTCHECGRKIVEGWNCELFPAVAQESKS